MAADMSRTAWDSLIAVVTAYVNDPPVLGGDSVRAVILAAIGRTRAALERPRPAPPDTLESVTAWLDSFDWWDENTKGMARAILKRYGGGTAGTGAAPPSEALTRSRIDHWLRNRGLQFYSANSNTRVGFGQTADAIIALMDDLAEYACGGAAQPPPSSPSANG
jgi:hypothetical protein